ncbi:MAG: glycosyltransferase family 2 protein [Candidatus Acidiferrales bacterium]
MPHPTVTVLVDTYNHERFIEEALVSVVEQDFPASDMEILVVDDGSTDRTPEIVRKFAPRVRLLSKTNGGQASAFNFGIPEARGEIVAFLDGDDWWVRNKVTCVAQAMAADPTVGIVGHGIVEVDGDSKHLRTLIPPEMGTFTLRNDDGAQTFRNYMAFLGTSRVTIRKSILLQILPIPDPLIVEADEFMSAAVVAAGSAVLLPEPLTFYRLHDGNLFQFRSADPVRLRRKQTVLASLADELSQRLDRMGVSPSAKSIVVEPIRISALRLRLSLDGGSRRDTYRVEKADFQHAYQRVAPGYRAWKQLSLLLTLLLPPRRYYGLRQLYSALGLRRFRSWLGEPQPRTQIKELQLHPGATHAEK